MLHVCIKISGLTPFYCFYFDPGLPLWLSLYLNKTVNTFSLHINTHIYKKFTVKTILRRPTNKCISWPLGLETIWIGCIVNRRSFHAFWRLISLKVGLDWSTTIYLPFHTINYIVHSMAVIAVSISEVCQHCLATAHLFLPSTDSKYYLNIKDNKLKISTFVTQKKGSGWIGLKPIQNLVEGKVRLNWCNDFLSEWLSILFFFL